MKPTAILTATLGLLLGSLHAQTVPTFLNYQGRVTDSAGVGLGTGTPVNRKIVFRIYDAASGGTKMWTEEQTVTISNGEFSVLLGLGIDATGTAAGEVRPAIASVFTSLVGSGPSGANRFIGVTVDNGDNTINASDVEIAPRQQITSTAYAFRADVANQITAGSDSTFTGTTIAGGTFTGSTISAPIITGGNFSGGGTLAGTFTGGTLSGSTLSNPTIAGGTLSGTFTGGNFTNATFAGSTFTGGTFSGTFSGNGSALTSLNGANLTNGTVADTKLTSNVALKNVVNTFTEGQNIKKAKPYLGLNNPGVSTLFIAVGEPVLGGRAKDSTIRGYSVGSNDHKLILSATINNPQLALDGLTGNVGIGTTDPSLAKLVVHGSVNQFIVGNTPLTGNFPNYEGNADAFTSNGGGGLTTGHNIPLSIWASNSIMGTSFIAKSDKRIKDVVGQSDSHADLDLINRLSVTDYRMKDRLTYGTGIQKGLIAQEVEAIIPEAVNRTQGFIPDVYEPAVKTTFNANQQILTLEMAKPHQLALGEKIQIHADQETLETEVIAVATPMSFSVKASAPADRAFVYGRQVNDFMAVNYDRIFTTAVGAVQELSRKLDEKDTQIVALQERLAALEAKDQTRESRLIAIESLLRPAGQEIREGDSLKTVSTKP